LAAQVERHQITWHWVKGHTGNRWNERADHLARSAIPRPELPLDDELAIHIFTGASYLGKDKKGGWGVLLRYGDRQKTLSGNMVNTSSNRMHLQAAIEGLRSVKTPLPIHLYTTSDYLKDGATAWVKKWIVRDWRTQDGKSVSHRDLWEQLAELTKRYQINWHVVPKKEFPPEMTQAKELATTAARSNTEIHRS
jgi:ribonuclease HI